MVCPIQASFVLSTLRQRALLDTHLHTNRTRFSWHARRSEFRCSQMQSSGEVSGSHARPCDAVPTRSVSLSGCRYGRTAREGHGIGDPRDLALRGTTHALGAPEPGFQPSGREIRGHRCRRWLGVHARHDRSPPRFMGWGPPRRHAVGPDLHLRWRIGVQLCCNRKQDEYPPAAEGMASTQQMCFTENGDVECRS